MLHKDRRRRSRLVPPALLPSLGAAKAAARGRIWRWFLRGSVAAILVMGLFTTAVSVYRRTIMEGCSNWELDAAYSRELAAVGHGRQSAPHVDFVYVFAVPDCAPEFLNICELQGYGIMLFNKTGDLRELQRVLQALEAQEEAPQVTAPPSWHLVFVDRENQRYGYMICTQGSGRGKGGHGSSMDVLLPDGGRFISKDLWAFMESRGAFQLGRW